MAEEVAVVTVVADPNLHDPRVVAARYHQGIAQECVNRHQAARNQAVHELQRRR